MWESYLIPQEFVFYSGHEYLRYFKTQKHINKMHAHWATYLEQFAYVIKHKSGATNRVVDVLSRRANLLVLRTEIVCFDYMNELYSLDDDFQHVWEKCKWHGFDGELHMLEGFLFKRKCLRVPNTSLREHVIRELHGGGFRAHLGLDKTMLTYVVWSRDIIGLGLNEMLSRLFEVVLYVWLEKAIFKIPVFIWLCQCRTIYGGISVWILFWIFLGHKRGKILYVWLLIGF